MNDAPSIPPFWFRWLVVVVAGLMVFGISMVLAPGLIRQFFSLLVYADPGGIETRFSAEAVDYITLVHGVLGAVMFGWGTMMLMALLGPFRSGRREGWIMITVSVAAWFLPDTVFSLWTGFWQNAVLNLSFGLMFAIPLAATYRSFRRESE